jgi:hypothetical protein
MSSPTRESIASEMSEIIRFQHDMSGASKPITETDVKSAIVGLSEFYLKPTSISENIPYQYKLENQNEFELYQVIISTALDKIEPVISDMKERLFRLEKNQTPLIMPNQNQGQPINIPTNVEPEKKSISSLFSGKPKPAPINPNDPYQSSLDLQKKTMKIIEYWDLVVEWQSEGVEMFEDFNRSSYDNYLSTHRVIFRKEVVPNLLRVYSQGLNIILMKEKEMAMAYGGSMMKEMFQTRNDFSM